MSEELLRELSMEDRKMLDLHQIAMKRSLIDVMVTDMLLLGLQTDGVHHKQWALWRIGEILGLTHFLSDVEDKGTAP